MSPKVKKILETFNKMGVMSESVRSQYNKIVNEMINDLSEDELEELSKSTLGSYIKKASISGIAHGTGVGKGSKKEKEKTSRGITNRIKGIHRATDKLSK